jgi:hypothetical protein
MWPIEARTTKSLPRYLLIVRALAGLSTITSDFFARPLPLDFLGSAASSTGASADSAASFFLAGDMAWATYIRW